jgi:hypothetical protein
MSPSQLCPCSIHTSSEQKHGYNVTLTLIILSSMSVQSLGLSNCFALKWLLLGPTYKGYLPKLAKMHEALHLVIGEDRP